MTPEHKSALRRVVEKAEKLQSSRFVDLLLENRYRVKYSGNQIDVTKPDDEARDAFILTLRFFTMSNEQTSFKKLAKLENADDISASWKESFKALRSSLNDYLQMSYGEYTFGGSTRRYSNREIVDVFLYGGLVHANDPKMVAKFEEWQKYPYIFALLEMWFIAALQTQLRAVQFLSAICRKELEGA